MLVKSSTFLLALAAVSEAASIWPYKPWVSSKYLRHDVSINNLMNKARELEKIADKNGGNRKWGSPAHWKTLEWIEKQLKKTGYYDVYYQHFKIAVSIYDKIEVKISDNSPIEGILGFNGGANGTVSGEMIFVNLGCKPEDFPATARGKIVLLQRGTCKQGLKNSHAQKVGALGIVSYNDNNPPPDPPTLGTPQDWGVEKFLVSAFIGKETGEKLKEKLAGGAKLSATITSVVREEQRPTANLIADTKCGNKNAIISAGAHSDSVRAGPGINDDGTGTISQLEVALQLTKYEVKNQVRWAWWSAEEDGLLGSYYYARHLSEADKARIVLNMDFDMLASDNYVIGVYDGDGSTFPGNSGAAGSVHLEQTFIDYFTSIDQKTVPIIFNNRSDYAGFLEIGIPAGGIAAGAEEIKTEEEQKWFGGKAGEPLDKCYHQACDRVANLNTKAWKMFTDCVADSIAKYAMSYKGVPFPRKTTKKPTIVKRSLKYMSDDGVMYINDSNKPVKLY